MSATVIKHPPHVEAALRRAERKIKSAMDEVVRNASLTPAQRLGIATILSGDCVGATATFITALAEENNHAIDEFEARRMVLHRLEQELPPVETQAPGEPP